MIEGTTVVEMRGITKTFPGIVANDAIDFDVRAGEVHALLGENGAGKSTLMNVLAGLYRPDAGEILFRGRPCRFRSARDSIGLGIGMVHQHFKLVEAHTVAENVILGYPTPRFLLDMGRIEGEVRALSECYGLPVDPAARVWQLSVGEQQRIEILKVLHRGAQVLVLDEPTAVLTPQEAEAFFETIRRLTSRGRAVVLISHKLKEVMAVADRITVLRKGRVAGRTAPRETTEEVLAETMVGRKVVCAHRPARGGPGEVVLEVTNLRARDDRRLPALRGVDLSVRGGEILGIAGVAGNGQRELAETLAGLRRATGGRVSIRGRDATNLPPREIIRRKVRYVPEDRIGTGLVPALTIGENQILKDYRFPPLSRGAFLVPEAILALARRLMDAFAIDAPGPRTRVQALSGGNQQKVLLSRELLGEPDLLIAVYPTRGLDVGAAEFIHRRLFEQRDAGTAILLVSLDLDEILALSDRVAVLYEGRIVGELPAEGADPARIGLMMAGRPAGALDAARGAGATHP